MKQPPTFKKVFDQWYAHYERTVKTKTALQTHRLMETKVLPHIGTKPIHHITAKDVLNLYHQVNEHTPNTAKRIVNHIIKVMDYAVVILQVIKYNKALPVRSYFDSYKVKGMKFVSTDKLPQLFADITAYNRTCDVITCAFWLLVYTALRRTEVAHAKKCEFDLSAKRWTIPAERMKVASNGEHIVPLSPQVIKLIAPLFDDDSEYLFPSPIRPNEPVDPWSLYQVLRQSNWHSKQTLHGFRKIFSTHAHLSRLWTIDAIELSLAHKIGGVRGVYNHADMLDERVELMNWWADEVDKWRGVA